MADPQYSDLPPGAQVVSAPQAPTTGSNPSQEYSDIPQGAQVVQNPSTSGQPEQPGVMERAGQAAGAGMAETMAGLGKIGSHIPGVQWAAGKVGDVLGLPKIPEGTNPYEVVEKSAQQNVHQATQTTAGKVGYGGEVLTEFILGDEALKGLSMADKLTVASKIAKWLEKSPKAMHALQIGADTLKNYPKASEIIGEAMKQGVVQGAQTTAKTGGDVKEGLKEGATMAATSGALGGAFAGAGKVLGKAGKAAETVETLGKVAEAAPTKEEVTEGAKAAVDTAKQQMHNRFETGIQDLTERLGDKELPHANSPIVDTAKELIKSPEPAEHNLVAAAKEAAGERIDKPVQNLLKKAATASEGDAWKVGDLVEFRQTVRKLADSYPPGDPNARTLYKLLPSVDDTLGKLADASGDATAKSDYAALRTDYKDKIKYFQPSGKLEDKVAYRTANMLREGSKDDIGNYLLSGGNTRAKVEAVQGLLGDEGTKQIGKNVFSSMVADSKGNPATLVKSWNKIPDAAKSTLFDAAVGDKAITDLMADTKSAANIQQFNRALLAGGVGAGLGALSHTGVGTLLGLAIGEGGGFAAGRKVLDFVANNPRVWKSLGIIGKVGEAAKSPAAKVAGTVVKQQAGSGLAGILQGASQPLSEGDNQ